LTRLSAIHANHKRIASGALLIGALTVVAKLFVAGREMAIAWRYGVSATADAYQLALTIAMWLPMMLTSVMTVVLVPRLVGLQRRAADRRQFLSELNGTVLILGAGVAGLIWLAAPAASALLASHAELRTLHLTAGISRAIAPVALLVIATAYLSARLQARERFMYSVTEAIPALIIGTFVIAPLGLAGAAPLIVGTLVGYVLQVFLLGLLVVGGDPPLGGTRVRHTSSEWHTLYGSVLLMVIAQLLITFSVPIDQGFAARLGEGAVATLGYANRIITLFSGLASIVVGRALLPVLSGAVADGDLALGRRHALQWAGLLAGAAALGCAVLWIAAPGLVRILFQRGAFDAMASANVAGVLRYGLLQLPFFFGGMALVQWYAALGRFRAVLSITTGALAVKFGLNAVLTPVYGIDGIMIATASMYLFTSATMWLFIGRASPADLGDRSE
jgi:peptidoglycan biosynthesis protein MviN/MurJ (putative lipid II flippase)